MDRGKADPANMAYQLLFSSPMRLYTQIDEVKSRVLVTFADTVTLHDVREMMYTSAKAHILGLPTLLDVRNVSIALSSADVGEILESSRELAAQSFIAKCAILVSSEEVFQRLAQVCEVLSQVSPLRTFLDRIEAERWLGWSD